MAILDFSSLSNTQPLYIFRPFFPPQSVRSGTTLFENLLISSLRVLRELRGKIVINTKIHTLWYGYTRLKYVLNGYQIPLKKHERYDDEDRNQKYQGVF